MWFGRDRRNSTCAPSVPVMKQHPGNIDTSGDVSTRENRSPRRLAKSRLMPSHPVKGTAHRALGLSPGIHSLHCSGAVLAAFGNDHTADFSGSYPVLAKSWRFGATTVLTIHPWDPASPRPAAGVMDQRNRTAILLDCRVACFSLNPSRFSPKGGERRAWFKPEVHREGADVSRLPWTNPSTSNFSL